ncbi:MAG: hypothetical protein ACFFCQ_04230, partial [Promethearchaeota archaeon]
MKNQKTLLASFLLVVTTFGLLFVVNAQFLLNNNDDNDEQSFWFSDLTINIFESFPEQYLISVTFERTDASVDLEYGISLFAWKTDVLENSLPS